jgi:mRNA-degrading endonuclease YafQ of YafQ-DinJ toxin-antitoxin module
MTADKKIILLRDNPIHPSLRSKRVKGTKNIWESSVNMDIRITWQYKDENAIILRNIGHHDAAFRKP